MTHTPDQIARTLGEEDPSDLIGLSAGARQEAAHLLGRARTLRKAKAARQNAHKGGRPKGFRLSSETRQRISDTKRGIRRAKYRGNTA